MRKKTQKAKYMQVDNDTASYEKRSEIYNMRDYDFTETHILCNKYHMI